MSCNMEQTPESACGNPSVSMGFIGCSATGNFERPLPCECREEEMFIVKGACSQSRLESLLQPGDVRWTQIFVPEVLCVPEQKPDVEELISVTSSVQIIAQRVIRTPVFIDPDGRPVVIQNQEGTFLTGRKLVIEGVLKQKIVYTAANPEQSVHAAHFDVPFSAFIILEPTDLLTQRFKIEACIEDIFVTRITARQIFKNVTLFIKATPIVCPAAGGR